jgi:sporulation protein YlmC with PRC-barrel domain
VSNTEVLADGHEFSETNQGKAIMKMPSFVAGTAVLSAILLASPVWAQGAPQTVKIERVDVKKLSAGYRASKIIGSSVVNDTNEKIGDIADLLVEPSDKVLFAVLSVGGFLGMGEHLVVVPFNSLQITGNRVVLPGGSKEELRALPVFNYATN